MSESSIVDFSTYFSKATQEIIKVATGLKVHVSNTFQKIPSVKMRGNIGSFVSFKEDYNGMLIMNFSGDSALEIVTAYLKKMGMPESDIPVSYTSDDVRSNIGELVNQIMGKSRNLLQKRFDLAAMSNISAVVPITTPIGLILESADQKGQECMRLSLSTPLSNKFYIELSMEPTSLIELEEK